MNKDFYKAREVAERIGVSTATVHRMLDAGELPSAYFGKLRRVPKADFEQWLDAKVEDARAHQRQRKVVPIHARINS